MPSGAKKRKAAKKKKVNNSSTINPHQAGENVSSENISKDANEEEGKIEIEIESKSKSCNGGSSGSSDSSDDDSHVVEKNVVVLESSVNELLPAVESLPEKDSPIVVDPVKPVDSLFEQLSQVFDEIKNEKKKDFVVEEQTVVVSETDTKDDKDDCPTSSVVAVESIKENDVENLISEDNGANCANETDTIGHSNRQAPAASTAVAMQSTTTWKSCCGIFELFSRSER